jgi:DNA-binding transcriptional LysR family regulator
MRCDHLSNSSFIKEMIMELRHIRYFLAVAEERHFTRAASKVGIGQPPLSQQIKDLETEVGANLFHRVAHGAELTPAGEAFLDGVKEIPSLVERASKAARRAARGETGCLRVGFTASLAFNAVVPSSIRAFRRAYADVELSLEEANTTELIARLHDGTLDIAFLRQGTIDSTALQLHLLLEEPMMAALPVSHPAAAREEVDLKLLKNDLFVLFPRAVGPTVYDTIIDACRQAGFEPELGQFAPQIDSVVNFVAAELGVSIVPASMSQLCIAGVTYRAIAGNVPIVRLALAYRRTDTSHIVRNFVTQAIA